MTATDVATKDSSTDVATEADNAPIAGFEGLQDDELVLPMLKIGQQLTSEVEDDDNPAKAGDYINSLTGKTYGSEVEFVVCGAYKGRLYSPENEDRTYVAQGDVAPDNWPDEYAGKPFADIPDAEEQWKVAANAEGGEWGSGPPIQTTRNFIGFVVDDPEIPVRLSLKGSSTPTAHKIRTLYSIGGKAPWASSVKLSTDRRENARKQPYYVAKAEPGTQQELEGIENAKRINAAFTQAQSVKLVGDDAADEAKGAKPKAPTGGVKV